MPTTGNDAYKQFHFGIVVDSHQENANFLFIQPIRTSQSGTEEKQTSSTILGTTSTMAASFNAGLNPAGSMSFAKGKSKQKSASSEKTLHINGIDEQHFYGKIWWNFDIDDVKFQQRGTVIRKADLPTVHFEFTGDSVEPDPLPTSAPEYVDIVIISYWKMTPPSGSKSNWIRRLTPWSTGGAQAPSYSNIFQIIALKVNPDKFKSRKRCDYRVEVVVNPEASDPHEVIPKRHAGKFVNVIPAVVNGKYITFTDFKFWTL